jgi:hypothetical protein
MDLHAKVYGYSAQPRTIVGMIGAWVLQSTVATAVERGESIETDAGLTVGCELLESVESFAMVFEQASHDWTSAR